MKMAGFWFLAVLLASLREPGPGLSFPLIYAHRGARSLAPENTLAAARMAAQLGAQGWEFDVRLTKDGELILIHDDTLARTTNAKNVFPDRAPWKVTDFAFAEIRTLDAGSWFVESDPFGTLRSGELTQEQAAGYRGERIPTLREALVLSLALGLLVNIEIKAAQSNSILTVLDEIAVRKTVDLVRELRLIDQVLISSFNPGVVRRVKELAPEIKTALLAGTTPRNVAWLARELGVDAINPDYHLFSDEELCALHAQGLEIYVWTVNEIPELERFLHNTCVTGIITDWPQRLLRPARP